MNLNHLYYFKVLAETEHYTQAANMLNITQPSLSHAISQLEDELNCYLFEKDTFNKLGYKTKINTHITSCINLFLDIYLYSEYRLIYC
jgi:hypothetical protein